MRGDGELTHVRRFKPYPKYKDSGVGWLGTIPASWKLLRVRHAAAFLGGGTPSKENAEFWSGDIPWVSPKDMKTELVEDAQDHITRSAVNESATKLVPPGAVLLVVRSGILNHSIPIAINHVEVALNQDMKALVPVATVRPRYLSLVIQGCQEPLLVEWRKEGATVESLEVELIRNTRFPIPPTEEQDAIVAFLDRETAKFDALVAKKERLIELLQEKRTAIITHAVTKGLDPNAPTKQSGVDWLGEIPHDWDVMRNKRLFREIDSRSLAGEEELLTVSHITGVTRRSEKNVTMIEPESHERYKLCSTGDLVINTMWAWMGALGVAKEDGMVSPNYNVYRMNGSSLIPRYYDYLCRIPAHVIEIIRYSNGVWRSRLRLYPEEFFQIWSPLPPIREQIAIAHFLDNTTREIERLIGKIGIGIERLQEYRTALISAAVTGKIDVREAAASRSD